MLFCVVWAYEFANGTIKTNANKMARDFTRLEIYPRLNKLGLFFSTVGVKNLTRNMKYQ